MIKKVAPLFFLLLAACATNKTTFTPAQVSSEEGSAVYVYRASQVSSLMLPPNISLKDTNGNQTTIGKLNHGEYKLVYLEPGTYEVQLDEIKYYASGKVLTMEVKPETTNYLRLDASLKFETGVRYKSYNRQYDLQTVDVAIALNELSSCVDVDTKPKKKSATVEVDEKGMFENDDDVRFSTDKTSDPFSRNQ